MQVPIPGAPPPAPVPLTAPQVQTAPGELGEFMPAVESLWRGNEQQSSGGAKPAARPASASEFRAGMPTGASHTREGSQLLSVEVYLGTLTTQYSVLTTYYSPLTTHYSPLTTDYSLLTTHY